MHRTRNGSKGQSSRPELGLKREKHLRIKCLHQVFVWDFPGGQVVKTLPANAGDTGSIPTPERFHMPQGSLASMPQLLKPMCSRAHAL